VQLCDNLAHAPPLLTLPATASKTLSVRANPSKRLHFAATTRLRWEAEASYRAGRWQDGWTFEYEADRAVEEVFICRLERVRQRA
jgi:hypothetical protein